MFLVVSGFLEVSEDWNLCLASVWRFFRAGGKMLRPGWGSGDVDVPGVVRGHSAPCSQSGGGGGRRMEVCVRARAILKLCGRKRNTDGGNRSLPRRLRKEY